MTYASLVAELLIVAWDLKLFIWQNDGGFSSAKSIQMNYLSELLVNTNLLIKKYYKTDTFLSKLTGKYHEFLSPLFNKNTEFSEQPLHKYIHCYPYNLAPETW